jgi:hypothetical protein
MSPYRFGNGDPGVVSELGAGEPVELGSEGGRLGRSSFELDPLVEVLGVLADHDEVDAGVTGRDTGKGPRGPDRSEQVELVPQLHVHAAEAAADRCRDGALQRHPGAPDLLQHARWKR